MVMSHAVITFLCDAGMISPKWWY